MSAVREAFVLPLLFLTATLLAGLQIGPRLAFAPPSAFSLMLASVMLGLLVRSGTLAPDRLLHGQRSILANANGVVALVSLFAASAQLLTMLTPASGLPLILFDGFLLVLLVNTMITAPDRGRAVRSLAVILGSAFLLKFVVLASLSDPDAGRMHRVLVAIFDVATMGAISQDPITPSSPYVAFAAIALYMIAVASLPAASRWLTSGDLSSSQAIARSSQ